MAAVQAIAWRFARIPLAASQAAQTEAEMVSRVGVRGDA
jgi:hypothetical protein